MRIDSILPSGETVNFAIKHCEVTATEAICSVIKDAGDDPDCTHLAELVATVRLTDTPGVELKGGSGVATVTKPGLGLEVNGPSITAMPRKNIIDMVSLELKGRTGGAEVTISVPRGEIMALETTNARLGLIGGISILGTTGIVKPYSTAAYRTSIVQAIDVAAHRKRTRVVLTTGGKSEQYAMQTLPELQEDVFIQVGDFIGTGVKHARRRGMERVYIFGMMGKLSKMADGVTQTHQAGSQVNMTLLAGIARDLGASPEAVGEIEKANTARHVLEICKTHQIQGLTDEICKRVVTVMRNFSQGVSRRLLAQDQILDQATGNQTDSNPDFEIVCCLVDFDGTMLGQYPVPGEHKK